MSKVIEKKAKTVNEAITLALKELGISKEEANIEIIEEASKGLLGIGSKPAVVKVSEKDNRIEIINEFLAKISETMNLSITNTIEEKEGRIFVNIEGKDIGLLIGYRGETLEALQTLLAVVINKNKDEYVKIDLDAEKYKQKRKDTLINLAKKKANDVIKYNKTITMEPMSSYERRIIHMALQDNDKITTYSIGEEPYRKIVIKKQ